MNGARKPQGSRENGRGRPGPVEKAQVDYGYDDEEELLKEDGSIQDEEEWEEDLLVQEDIKPPMPKLPKRPAGKAGKVSRPPATKRSSVPSPSTSFPDFVLDECMNGSVLDVLNTGIHIHQAQLSDGHSDEDYQDLLSHPKLNEVKMFSSHSYVLSLQDTLPCDRELLQLQYALGQTFVSNIALHRAMSSGLNSNKADPKDFDTPQSVSVGNLQRNYVLPALPPFKSVSLNWLLSAWTPTTKNNSSFALLIDAYMHIFTRGVTAPIMALQEYSFCFTSYGQKLANLPREVSDVLLELGLALAGYDIPELDPMQHTPQSLATTRNPWYLSLGPDNATRAAALSNYRRTQDNFLNDCLKVALRTALCRFRRLELVSENPLRFTVRTNQKKR